MSEAGAIPRLVEAARGGDRRAMDSLYRHFAPVVHGVLLAYVQPADADDMTQDVFEIALDRLHEVRDPIAFPGWLLSVARHIAIDSFRRRKSAGVRDAKASDPGAAPDLRLEADQALAAIHKLPPAYRETLLLLRLVEGLTGPEIAARTGLTPGSVRVNLHRGMAQLRLALGSGHRKEVEP